MRKRDKNAADAQDFTGMPTSTVVTPADIQSKEFNVSRFGGYRMRDVDEFLDQITESMTKLAEENERSRSASGLPAAPSIGAPDLADTSRQADEIIERARAEAATIVRDARAQAVAGSGTVGVGTGDGRAAVAPFLSLERDFLQRLATLVQSHAESVKSMAKASRTKPPAAASPATPPSSAPSPATPPTSASPPSAAPVSASQETERPVSQAPTSDATQPMPSVQPSPAAPESSGRDTPPIRVEETATAKASVGAGDPDDDAGQSEGGDRTLRELFWGEE
ncbi:MAG: DivIVA domain-containing protein [Actinomycetota bacterium]